MEQVKNGDKQAFEAIVLAHREAAVAFAAGILSDDYLAEDVVQDSFARVYLHREEYKPSHSFKTYLYTIIRRRCIDGLRRKQRDPADLVEKYPALPGGDTPEELYLREERRGQLRHELALLSPVQRATLYLYAVEGMPYKEIAAIQGLTVAQVKIGLHRARKKLKQQLELPERSKRHEE